VREALAAIRTLCRAILPIDIDAHARRCGLQRIMAWRSTDARVVVAALRAGCGVLRSEDMQDGLVVDGRVRIVNPFR